MKLTGRSDDELLTEVCAYLTVDEASFLLQSRTYYFDEEFGDPDWHHHVGGEGGPELTIAISPTPNRYGDGAASCSS